MRLYAFLPLACVALLALVAASPAEDAKEAAAKEKKLMEGTWDIVSVTVDGNDVPKPEEKATLVVKGDTWAIKVGDTVNQEGTFKIDPTIKIKTIDVMQTKPDGSNRIGIYELKGDEMKICLVGDGKDRPTAFESKSGSGAYLAVYKKSKP
jgi:uncharacterized protein (TIGR03067 family)